MHPYRKFTKQLLARQSELNSQLDLDKGDQQGADCAPEIGDELDKGKTAPTADGPAGVAKMAEAYMRASGRAIREIPVVQRPAPATGSVVGRAVARDDAHIAVSTAANRFIIVESSALGREVEIGETLSLLFSNGRPSIDGDRGRDR